MPYPCCGPRAASVFSTIKANVPCQTSVLSAIVLDSNRRLTPLLLESKTKPSQICQPLPWRRNVIRCDAAFEPPAAVCPHEDIVVAAGLRDYRLAVGTRGDEGPPRPCR